ncbi:hypothetical protein D3218_13695 [Aureimonas flava]|uniref:ParB-like N-terminal domain-containing protein n=1 Tax=Aureimonas flava TaxID=2320271 RepID=A0A3A1WJV7_9HYPH|nr:hypothetical protein D3218_13695 [Aureimonas flava]
MSHAGESFSVRVADLVMDESYQVRAQLDDGAVSRYADAMRSGQEFPPISIARVGGAVVIVDGFHRVTAARKIRRETITAVLVERDEAELQWLAAEANLKHGVPLKRGEGRKLLTAYVRAGRHRNGTRRVKSSRDIAKDLHGLASHSIILRWMKADFPEVARRMTERRVKNTGVGDDGIPRVDLEEKRQGAALVAIDHLIAHSRGIIDPERRGIVLAKLRAALEEVEGAGEWEPMAATAADDGF